MSDQTFPLLSASRRRMFVRYIACVGVLNLAWEILQLPLYTLWNESAPAAIAFAVVHCTLGDVLVATGSLFAAVVLLGRERWPHEYYWRVALLAGAMGVSYTAFSEWNNTVVTRTWAYSSLMPTLWGIGLSPVLQWLLIPAFAFWRYRHQSRNAAKAI